MLIVSGIDDEEVMEILSRLIASSLLPGVLRGRDYIPNIFSAIQRSSVDLYFKSNGYIELSRIRKFQVYLNKIR